MSPAWVHVKVNLMLYHYRENTRSIFTNEPKIKLWKPVAICLQFFSRSWTGACIGCRLFFFLGGGSCGCLYYMLDRITFHKKKKKNCLIKLQSACIIFDILLKLGGFKDSMFKPQTVWNIKAVVWELSKCHRGGSSTLLMLISWGTVMTGLKVFQQPYQCWGTALMSFLPLFEYPLWGYEHESLFHSLDLHIFHLLNDVNS